MPAYRSTDEAEIRVAVVERLRILIPGCRIIHEINAMSFGNRIDVLAVGRDRIAAVEIKSKKDKLDRLPDQIAAMSGVTHEIYAALHEKFLEPFGPDGEYGVLPPKQARGAMLWAYPRIDRKGHVEAGQDWRESRCGRSPPYGALKILWRDELQALAAALGVARTSKMTMDDAIDHIKWLATGKQIREMICKTLRARQCVEADPEINS